MAALTSPNLGLKYGRPLGDGPWDGDFNLIAEILDALLHLSVHSMTTTAPPGSPASGDRYIVPVSATGAWAGQDKKIAYYLSSAWMFFSARTGMQAFVEDASPKGYFVFDGTNWVLVIPKANVEISDFTPGVPIADQVLLSYQPTKALTLPAALAGSFASAAVAATAAATLTISKNGTAIGTINFALGATAATFTLAGAITFAAGDMLAVAAQHVPDVTLAGLSFSLFGSR